MEAVGSLELAPTTAAPSPWRRRLGRLGAAVLGGVLLVATAAKALDPAALGEWLVAEGVSGGLPPLAAAWLALAIEGGLGIALLLGARRPVVLAAAATLVAFFLFLTGRAWWVAAHGGAADATCGCFGNLVQRSPAAAFWQDLALLVPALLLAFVGRPTSGPWRRDPRLLAALAGAAGIALFAWAAPALPLDDVATRLRPGAALDQLCTGGEQRVCLADVAPELQSGRWQVVLVDVQRNPAGWAPALNRLAEDGRPLLALTASPADQVAAFTWEWGPSYPLRQAPPALLRPLHRSLPRSFVSEDGRVMVTASGLPDVLPAPATAGGR